MVHLASNMSQVSMVRINGMVNGIGDCWMSCTSKFNVEEDGSNVKKMSVTPYLSHQVLTLACLLFHLGLLVVKL